VRRAWALLRPFAGPLVGVALLGVLLARLGTAAVADALRAVGPGTVAAALGIGVLTTVLSAGRWCLVARELGLRLPLRRAVADCYRAMFLNSVLPAGVLGDVHRAVSHGRRAGDLARGVRAVALERAAGLAVLIAIGVTVLASHPGLAAGVSAAGWPVLAAALAATGLLAALVGSWLARAAEGTRRARLRGLLVTVAGDARGGGVLGGRRRRLPGTVRAGRPGRRGHRRGGRPAAAADARAAGHGAAVQRRWLGPPGAGGLGGLRHRRADRRPGPGHRRRLRGAQPDLLPAGAGGAAAAPDGPGPRGMTFRTAVESGVSH
jgi:hypothetical protein